LQWRSCNSRGAYPPALDGRRRSANMGRLAGADAVAEPRGAYSPRSCSRAVRRPTELRLLRCTNEQSAPGAASVSPPCGLTKRTLRVVKRKCNCKHGLFRTAGLRPPLLVGVTVAGHAMRIARATSACSARLGYAPRSCSRAVRPPTELRLLRCTNEQSAPGAASVSPPCLWGNARARMTTPGFTQRRRTCTKSGGREPAVVRETHLQRRYRTCSVDGRRCVGGRPSNRVVATTGGLTPPALACRHGSPACYGHSTCELGMFDTGAYAPTLVRATFASRRNCDFCDAQTHTQQERRA